MEPGDTVPKHSPRPSTPAPRPPAAAWLISSGTRLGPLTSPTSWRSKGSRMLKGQIRHHDIIVYKGHDISARIFPSRVLLLAQIALAEGHLQTSDVRIGTINPSACPARRREEPRRRQSLRFDQTLGLKAEIPAFESGWACLASESPRIIAVCHSSTVRRQVSCRRRRNPCAQVRT